VATLGVKFLSDIMRPYFLSLIFVILFAGNAFAAAPNPQSDVPAPSVFMIRERNYPVESRRIGEQGMCQIAFAIDAKGVVKETYIVVSTGFRRLDAACTAAVTGHIFDPSRINTESFPYWSETTINYRLNLPNSQPHLRSKLHVGAMFYPETSRQMHQEGTCAVHVHVEQNGTPNDPEVVRSTSFASLDQACIAAVMAGTFDPGTRKSRPYADWVNVVMSWRLPP
jgi:TonB family protein